MLQKCALLEVQHKAVLRNSLNLDLDSDFWPDSMNMDPKHCYPLRRRKTCVPETMLSRRGLRVFSASSLRGLPDLVATTACEAGLRLVCDASLSEQLEEDLPRRLRFFVAIEEELASSSSHGPLYLTLNPQLLALQNE